MEDLNTLARDFGLGPGGKSNPMRPAAPMDRRPIYDPSFRDVFGGPSMYTSSSNLNSKSKQSPMSDFDYASIFNSSAAATEARKTNNGSDSSSVPVYDKPVYDEDIFDGGVQGLKSKSASSSVMFNNDVFASISSPPSCISVNQDNDFDDFLENLGRNEKTGKENIRSNSIMRSSSSKGFDDLLDGFGSVASSPSNRPVLESKQESIPDGDFKHKNVSDDPFSVLKSSSSHQSSSSPPEEISGFRKSRTVPAEASSVGGVGFDDLDPLNSFGKSKANSSFRYSRSNVEKKLPVNNFQEPPLFDARNISTGFQKSFFRNASSPRYFETSQDQCDDMWLSVSEVPLFTQPTTSPPPSRPPPSTPRQTSNYNQHSYSRPNLARPAAKDPPVSQFDDFAKNSKNKETVLLEKDYQDGHERRLREIEERLERERSNRKEDEERSREIERERGRQAVQRATWEARDRSAVQAREKAAAEARLKTERASVQRANAEARERAGRVAVERVQAEARERAAAEAKERAGVRDKRSRDKADLAKAEDAKMGRQRNDDDLESFFSTGRASSATKIGANSSNKGVSEAARSTSSSSGASSNMKRPSSRTNIVDDLSSIFGAAPSSREFQEVEGETEERRRSRLDREQRTQERAVKAVAVKNQRDLQAQIEQEERHRISEPLDIEIKRWAAGKEGNLRALLSTLQYVLWPECGWQPVSLTDLIIGASVKKYYRKATLCIHPDKVQQKGATLQQKYIAEKVFDLLKEAWNKFNSQELF